MVEGQGRRGNIWGPLRQWQAVCHGWRLGTVDMLMPTTLQIKTLLFLLYSSRSVQATEKGSMLKPMLSCFPFSVYSQQVTMGLTTLSASLKQL